MAEKGLLTDRPVVEIFRDLAASGRSGVLRITSDSKIVALVFEKGRPVFAISNVPEHQLDVLLVRQKKLTREQAVEAKSQIFKEADFASKIIQLGYLDHATVEEAMREQGTRIVQAVLSWYEGEYVLDYSARVNRMVTLEVPLGQVLLDAARQVPVERARERIGPPETKFVLPTEQASVEGISVSSLDGFLLSRMTQPMTADEICAASGLPESEAIPTLYALYAAGLITIAPSETPEPVETGPTPEEVVARMLEELDAMLASFASADHYQVLDIERSATSADVKRAYYNLAKRYHPDRYHHANDSAIRERLEVIFAHIARAYDTLSDGVLRGDYDRQLGPASEAPRPAASAPTPAPAAQARPVARPSASTAGASVASGATASRPAEPMPPPATPPPTPPPRPAPATASTDEPIGGEPPKPPPTQEAASEEPGPRTPVEVSPERIAEQNFTEGMRRLQNRDFIGAVQLLREAVKHYPNNGKYHYELGVALLNNPRWHKQAEVHLLEAIRTEPLNANAYSKLGQIYQKAGLAKRAESQYRTALSIDGRNIAARQGLVEMGLDVPAASDKGGDKGSGGLFSKIFKKK